MSRFSPRTNQCTMCATEDGCRKLFVAEAPLEISPVNKLFHVLIGASRNSNCFDFNQEKKILLIRQQIVLWTIPSFALRQSRSQTLCGVGGPSDWMRDFVPLPTGPPSPWGTTPPCLTPALGPLRALVRLLPPPNQSLVQQRLFFGALPLQRCNSLLRTLDERVVLCKLFLQWTCSGCLLRPRQRGLQNVHLWTLEIPHCLQAASKTGHTLLQSCVGVGSTFSGCLWRLYTWLAPPPPLALSWGFPCCFICAVEGHFFCEP